MKKNTWYKDCRLWLGTIALAYISLILSLAFTYVIAAEWAGIFFALFVGITGIFHDAIKTCKLRPELNISFIPEPPDAHKVANRNKDSGDHRELEKEYNRFRPHSSLGYRPPAPETLELGALTLQL